MKNNKKKQEIDFQNYADCIEAATTPTLAWSEDFLKNYTPYNSRQFVRLFFSKKIPLRTAVFFILTNCNNYRVGSTSAQRRALKEINVEIGEIVHRKLLILCQSTRPHGARLQRYWLSDEMKAFQSTRPHGARRVRPLEFRRSKRETARVNYGSPRKKTGINRIAGQNQRGNN